MERKEDQQEEEEDIVCLDESFFINDKWVLQSLSLSLFLLYNLSVLLSLYLIIWCVKMCSYQLTTFTFGSQVIQLFCLHSASSEFLLYTVSVLQHNYIKLNPFHVFIWFLFFFSFFLGFFWVKYELGIGKLNNFISILYIFDIDFQWWS